MKFQVLELKRSSDDKNLESTKPGVITIFTFLCLYDRVEIRLVVNLNRMIVCRSKVVPVFTVSSVSGLNLPLLTRFFNVLPPQKNLREQEKLMQKPPEFQVSADTKLCFVCLFVWNCPILGNQRGAHY